MSDGFPNTYFIVSPLGFEATVFDSDDLSITRGSSLSLLAMPSLLRTHLQTEFPNLHFDWLQSSASELVFGCVLPGVEVNVSIERVTGKAPSGIKANKWNKALQAKANEAKANLGDRALRQAAQQILQDFKLSNDLDDIAGRILAKCGNIPKAVPVQLKTQQCIAITDAIKNFTSSKQDKWPFDLMLFSTVFYQPDNSKINPADIIAALGTRLGHARMQQISCVVPAVVERVGLSADKAVCGFTGVLAAAEGKTEKQRPISANAQRRREVGRDGKQGFYTEVLENAAKAGERWSGNALVDGALEAISKVSVPNFANDFSDIVADAPDDLPISVKSNICVLSMDGNSFGRRRTDVRDMQEYKRFTEYLDILKAGMLAKILIWVSNEENGMLHNDVARFETLLWGGDEFTFVLPAWKGWELASLIHDTVKVWKTLNGKKMTFATGLVFGPHKAPIRDLKNAVGDLVEMAKSAKPAAAWQAVAYESVDRIHFSPKGYRRDWLGVNVPDTHFNLPAETAIALPGFTGKPMLTAISRTQLHRLYYDHKILLASKQVDTRDIKGQIARIAPAMSDSDLEQVTNMLFPADDYPMLHFAQLCLLFDYIRLGDVRI